MYVKEIVQAESGNKLTWLHRGTVYFRKMQR